MRKVVAGDAQRGETHFLDLSLDAAPCGFASTAPDGTILWANRRLAEWSGRSIDVLVGGTRFDALLCAEGRDAYVSAAVAIAGRERREQEATPPKIIAQLMHVSGASRTVSVTLSAGTTTSGRDVINMTVIDLTRDTADGGTTSSGDERVGGEVERDTRLLLETAAEGIYCIDTRGRMTLCNAAFLRMLGYAEEAEVLGRRAHALLHYSYNDGSPYDEADCPLYAAATYGRAARVDTEAFFRADGSALPVEYWARPIWRNGELDGAICTFIDITERRDREDALRQSEQRLRRVIDGTLSFIGVVDVDGTLLEANKAALAAGGVTRDDTIGQKFWDCYWWSFDDGTIAELKADIERAAGGEIVRRDATVRVADDRRMTIDFMLSPAQADGGDVRYLIASGVDVTQRLQAERTRNRLAEIVEQSVDFVGTLDVEGRLLYVNRAGLEMIGKPLEDVRGLPLIALQPERAVQKIIEDGMPAAEADGAWTGETALRDANGDELPVSQSLLTHKSDGGRITHYSTVMRDISDLKETEEHQEFLLREILHRSKNLLAIIQAMASQTARTATSTDHFVRQFKKRVQGLSASHDLLVKQNWQGVPLHDLVQGQLSVFLPAPDDPRLRVEGPQVVMTTAAAQALGLALHELGTNAVKYGSLSVPTGRLSIVWRVDRRDEGGRRLVLQWTETGGPRVDQPEHGGFGRTVVEDMITQSLDCEVALDYDPKGFRWTMDAPDTCVIDSEKIASTTWFMPAGGRRSR